MHIQILVKFKKMIEIKKTFLVMQETILKLRIKNLLACY